MKEFYGVFDKDQLVNIARKYNFKLIHFESYLLDGYKKHLNNIFFEKGFMDSNAFWIFEKY